MKHAFINSCCLLRGMTMFLKKKTMCNAICLDRLSGITLSYHNKI